MRRIFTILFIFSAIAATAQQDTVLQFRLPTVTVDAKRNWDNDTIQYKYNHMKYYVTTILPYLDAATDVSYTHLDVYKRQLYYPWEENYVRTFFCW